MAPFPIPTRRTTVCDPIIVGAPLASGAAAALRRRTNPDSSGSGLDAAARVLMKLSRTADPGIAPSTPWLGSPDTGKRGEHTRPDGWTLSPSHGPSWSEISPPESERPQVHPDHQ